MVLLVIIVVGAVAFVLYRRHRKGAPLFGSRSGGPRGVRRSSTMSTPLTSPLAAQPFGMASQYNAPDLPPLTTGVPLVQSPMGQSPLQATMSPLQATGYNERMARARAANAANATTTVELTSVS